MEGKTRIEGLVEGGLMLLTEARRRSEEREADETGLGDEGNIRLGVAVAAAHTVLEPPSMPTNELRRMGLWWDEASAPIPGESGEPGPVVLTRAEAVSLRALVMGDAFDTNAINSFMAKVGEA